MLRLLLLLARLFLAVGALAQMDASSIIQRSVEANNVDGLLRVVAVVIGLTVLLSATPEHELPQLRPTQESQKRAWDILAPMDNKPLWIAHSPRAGTLQPAVAGALAPAHPRIPDTR
jgi:hypothetical protein